MKHRTSAAVCALLALGCCATASALPQAPDAAASKASAPAFTIVGAHVYDGKHWLPAGTQVRVQHGIVLAIGPNVGLARGGTLINASGKTLVPETENLAAAKPCDCSRGVIAPGAHADLRLVDGDASKTWNFSSIIARWRDGVPVGHHSSGSPMI